MRIVVMSDSHGDAAAVRQVLRENPGADGFIHLGDGYRDWVFEHPAEHQFLMGVCGNCDWTCDAPRQICMEFDGVRVLAVHGHHQNVKNGLSLLRQTAREQQAALTLYGHTHRPDTDYTGGLWLVNPGSLGDAHDPSYCVVELKAGKIVDAEHRRLK